MHSGHLVQNLEYLNDRLKMSCNRFVFPKLVTQNVVFMFDSYHEIVLIESIPSSFVLYTFFHHLNFNWWEVMTHANFNTRPRFFECFVFLQTVWLVDQFHFIHQTAIIFFSFKQLNKVWLVLEFSWIRLA